MSENEFVQIIVAIVSFSLGMVFMWAIERNRRK
jgi:hypothetical protein